MCSRPCGNTDREICQLCGGISPQDLRLEQQLLEEELANEYE